MVMRKILLVALTAAAMVSCSENEGFENESTMNRIKFGTVVKTGTKTLVATTENFSKFTVSAYKTTDDMGGTVQLNTVLPTRTSDINSIPTARRLSNVPWRQ